MKLSILIPTLAQRENMLAALAGELYMQIRRANLVGDVEILTAPDRGEKTVGAKRNELIERAKGDFVAFVDDDDEVSDDYVYQIYEAITRNPDADCVGMRGILTRGGTAHQRQVVYSIHYPGPFESGGIYYRPPGHLTPVRREIAKRYRYGDVSLGEDAAWSFALAGNKALKNEAFVDKILYHYRFNPKTSGTQKNYNVPVPNPSSADLWRVVILSARAENLKGCLEALFSNEPALDSSRVIVVDDGAFTGFDKSRWPKIVWTMGKKPFVFARNANVGISTGTGPLFLINDDAQLASRYGLSSLAYAMRDRQEIGICSAAIDGVAGGAGQTPQARLAGTRTVPNVAFVAVYLTGKVQAKIGGLDENFIGYGFEDNDYCLRAQKSGLTTAVYDGCVVSHGRAEASTFRSRPGWQDLMALNRSIFEKKWGTEVLQPAKAAVAEPAAAPSLGMTKGQEIFDREEYEAALPYFVAISRASEDAVERSHAMLLAARCHAYLGRDEDAEKWFGDAKKAAPDRREIPFFRAVNLIRARLLEDALEALEECLAIPASRRPFSPYDMLEVWNGSRPEEAQAFCRTTIEEAKRKANA